MINEKTLTIASIFLIASSFLLFKKEKPVFYIIGDSTVKNGDGTGKNNQMGGVLLLHLSLIQPRSMFAIMQ